MQVKCDHQRKEFRKREFYRLGKIQFHKILQCLECGKKIENKGDGAVFYEVEPGDELLPPFDESIAEKFRAKKTEQIRADSEEKTVAWWTKYEEYIRNSQEWKHRRELIIKRASGICEACLENTGTEVHHTSYSAFGDEALFDLRLVCFSCHKKIHRKTPHRIIPKSPIIEGKV